MAKFHALVKDVPEFGHILICAKSYINKVNCYNALIKAAVIFRLAVLINIGGQEASAAHTGVAMTIAVFIDFILEHNFLRNIIGDKPFGGALSRKLGEIIICRTRLNVILLQNIDKLRERRRNPYAALILNALISLPEGFFDN